MHVRKWASIAACGILILALMAYIYPGTLPNVRQAKASSVTISLMATQSTYGFYWNSSDPAITVTVGDTVTIQLSSSNGVSHQLLVDLDNDYAGGTGCTTTLDKCSTTFGASPTSITFTPMTAGTFHYYCTIHYPSMVGTFTVQNPPQMDFSLSATPSYVSIVQGANTNSTITVSSINNFMGTITLSASSAPTGPTFAFQTNPVTVSSPSATSKLTISIPSTTATGSYAVTVNGMNSTTTHSTSVSVMVTGPQVPNFAISSSPTTLSVSPGSSVTSSLTLTSQNGFSGAITLTTSVSPSGPQVSISPTGLTLASGGTNTATLTVTASGSGYYSSPTPTGSYTISVNATGPSFSRSTTVPLTVGSSSSGGANLSIVLIAGGVVAAIAIIAVAAFLFRRRK